MSYYLPDFHNAWLLLLYFYAGLTVFWTHYRPGTYLPKLGHVVLLIDLLICLAFWWILPLFSIVAWGYFLFVPWLVERGYRQKQKKMKKKQK